MNDYAFGNFLCELRESKGLTQADLAQELGVTPAAVSKWENGSSKPRIEILFRLATIFGVKSEELMAGHHMSSETINTEIIREINERYEYLRKVESYDTASVKIRRLIAWLIDWNMIGLTTILIAAIFLASIEGKSTASTVVAICLVFIILLYPVCFILRDWLFRGRSIGKRIMGLVVLDKQTGSPAKPGKCILRNLFLPIFETDAIIMLATGMTVGDHAAHTVVISKKILQAGTADPTGGESPGHIAKINGYSKPKTIGKKGVLIIISVIALFFVFLSFATLLALSAQKDTEEYRLCYTYLVESEAFKQLDTDPSSIRMYQYSLTTHTSDESDSISKTAEIKFWVGWRRFCVICHEENGRWKVCGGCTNFH